MSGDIAGAAPYSACHLPPAQLGAWSRAQSGDAGASDIHSALFRLEGPLDARVLEQSFQEIVRRHEVLRTTYYSRDGMPVPVLQGMRPFSLETVDLGDLPESD